MEGNKHTKAPWAWQRFGDTYSLTAQHGMGEIIIGAIVHGGMGYPVVGMNQEGILKDVDPLFPNAKLIAAAPELLMACEAFMELWKDSDMRPEDECHELAATIREAIKKATL